MRIGQLILLEGRRYIVEGVDPMSADPKRVHLRDVKTGRAVTRLLADVHAGDGSTVMQPVPCPARQARRGHSSRRC
jgi:hypothetical protein